MNLQQLLEYRTLPKTNQWNGGHLVFRFAFYLIIACFSVIYALGYRFNLQRGGFEQTGAIVYTISGSPDGVQISLNGVVKKPSIPGRFLYLLPGSYEISFAAPGYQPWTSTFNLGSNRAVHLDEVLLIKTSETSPLVASTRTTLPRINRDGLEVLHTIEIWGDGKFLTRLSKAVSNVAWYSDNQHFVYQTENTLWIYDPESNVTQLLATLPSNLPATYGFTDSGRTLVVQQNDVFLQRSIR